MKKLFALLPLVLSGCIIVAQDPYDPGPSSACDLTPGTRYSVTYQEQPGGTCGPLVAETWTIPDPNQNPPSTYCDSAPQVVGCSVVANNVTCIDNGFTIVNSENVSFHGTTGSGTFTAQASNSSTGQTCSSTYSVSATKL